MVLNNSRIRSLLKNFYFKTLFIEELGWDSHTATFDASVDGQTFALTAIAQKRGMVVFLHCPSDSRDLPDYSTRRKIERQVAKSVFEHLLIYTDGAKSTQIWQWVKREPGKPTACREHTYQQGQTGDPLIQKIQGIAFSLEEEETLSLPDVTTRTRKAFDVVRITKRFYDIFQKEHATFLKFLKGIPDKDLQRWYVSVMLNRLMFIYFIQKKNFLDGDPDYLRRKLEESQMRGKDLFYQDILCPLFFEGFGKQENQRSATISKLLGKVPYLNGGLFLRHQIEEQHGKNIHIADAAFEKLFGFFEQYQWHLDERPLRADNEINPDVLGYIFEKYINQKQMGAYYTKEDITGYISQNTIIPFLLDAARHKCKIAFEGDQSVWRLLQADPDRYVYEPVKKGVEIPLPEEIAEGLNDVSKRTRWNKPASSDFALPTEIWREVVARRKRYEEVRSKLINGEIREVNDLITYNLDIRQFAQDVIENCEGPELLRAFYHAIEKITVLDPTCGSGAFLFAALNILEPLYEACLDRMEIFLEDLDRSGVKHRPEKFSDFRKILDRVASHPNRRYFILKSIILNNLYGVDIMEEAVEICKLRLFLKLVAQVEKVEQIEPLPDIDFNIRAGNTLVGYANLEELKKSMEGNWVKLAALPDIEENAEIADRAFQKFHEMQTEHGMEAKDFADAKLELRKRLKVLEDELNRYLGQDYGVDPEKRSPFEKWLTSHKPFHWFIEFYGIMKSGGFDVIIGNPPWAEYAKVKKEYTLRNYSTETCGNLHGICTERSLSLRKPEGLMSFIVQLPMASSSRMNSVRNVLSQRSNNLFVIPFDDRPGKLFEGLQNCRSAIFISRGLNKNNTSDLATTCYQRWPTEVRPVLFALLHFTQIQSELIYSGQFPKYANSLEDSLFMKVKRNGKHVMDAFLSRRQTSQFIFYQEATRYWVKATVGLPYYAKNGDVGAPAHGRYLYFLDETLAHASCAVLNSSLFYVYFIAYGDCFHLSDGLVCGFPVSSHLLQDPMLVQLNQQLMRDLRKNAERKTINTADGHKISYDEFCVSRSKPVIDEIDRVLGKHYGFTDEELDFIINYDIKYRIGQNSGVDDGK